MLSENLKYLLEDKGYTQQDLADYLGVGKGAVCNWIHGRREPRVNVIAKIAKFFNTDIATLVGSLDDLKTSEEIAAKERAVSKHFAELMKRRMNSLNITVDELCDGTTIDKTKLKLFLDGKYTEPNLLKVETLAKKLQATSSYLLDWKVEDINAETTGLISKGRDVYCSLSNDQKVQAISYMLFLANQSKTEQSFDNQIIEQDA